MPVSVDCRPNPFPVGSRPMNQQIVFSDERVFDFLPLLNATIEVPSSGPFSSMPTSHALLESISHFFGILSRNFGVLFHSASLEQGTVHIFIPIERERFSHNAPVQTEQEIVSAIRVCLSEHGFQLKVGEVPLPCDDGE